MIDRFGHHCQRLPCRHVIRVRGERRPVVAPCFLISALQHRDSTQSVPGDGGTWTQLLQLLEDLRGLKDGVEFIRAIDRKADSLRFDAEAN